MLNFPLFYTKARIASYSLVCILVKHVRLSSCVVAFMFYADFPKASPQQSGALTRVGTGDFPLVPNIMK